MWGNDVLCLNFYLFSPFLATEHTEITERQKSPKVQSLKANLGL